MFRNFLHLVADEKKRRDLPFGIFLADFLHNRSGDAEAHTFADGFIETGKGSQLVNVERRIGIEIGVRRRVEPNVVAINVEFQKKLVRFCALGFVPTVAAQKVEKMAQSRLKFRSPRAVSGLGDFINFRDDEFGNRISDCVVFRRFAEI